MDREQQSDSTKWDRIFTRDGTKYTMQPWSLPPDLGRHRTSLYYEDTQGLWRSSFARSNMQEIVEALDDLLNTQQKSKRTRSGKVFYMDNEDRAPTELHIYGGYNDWDDSRFDYQHEAHKERTYDEALYLQEQLGTMLGRCAGLESLRLENMELYWKPGKANVQGFFENLRNCHNLKKLAVVNQNDGGDKMRLIIPEVCKLPLRELDLSGNQLYRNDMFPEPDEELERETNFLKVLDMLGTCKTLESLSLADMNLMMGPGPAQDDATTRFVLRLMQELKALKALDLSENYIHEEAQAAIEEAKPATLEVTF